MYTKIIIKKKTMCKIIDGISRAIFQKKLYNRSICFLCCFVVKGRKDAWSVCSVSLTEGGEQREMVEGEGEGDDARQGL